MLFLATAFALLQYVAAQDNSTESSAASATDIAVIEANFEQSQLVPNLLSEFQPQGLLSVTFGGNAITPGQKLEQSAVGEAPELAITPGSNASAISADDRYTVLMIDADIVGTDGSTTPLTRHWLVNGASLSTASVPWAITYDEATTITNYAGPGPAEGSGSHRYTVLVYNQPESFAAPANLSQPNTALSTMLLAPYVQESGLGALVAANYFQVEVGQATVTAAETTAVNTETISAAASSTSAAASGSPTGQASASQSGSASASRNPSGSASSAPAASPTGAASTQREMGWGVVVGAVGIAGAVLGAGLGL